jgi:hypothetical protein
MEMNLKFQSARLFLKQLAWAKRRQFEKALENPKQAQMRVLEDILKLSGKTSLPAFATDYTDYPADQSWSLEPVKFFETTSGSSGKKKAIPYTASLLNSFQNMFLIWIDDVLRYHKLKNGKLFISISPKLEAMGMDTDLEYLNPVLKWLISPFMAVKAEDFKALNGQEFFRKISIQLLNAKNLEVISIWSPSYLISLLDYISENIDSLELYVDKKTREKVRDEDWMGIWPDLKIISCWTDGSSQPLATVVKSIFPNVRIQGKGLLATEAPVTMPWTQASGSVPLWNEVYLEFQDEDGSFKPLYEIDLGKSVPLIVSTKGGLLRYRLGDIVECTHFYKQSPAIRFLRRAGDVSDLVGEKLDAGIVLELFSNLTPHPWLLVANRDHYIFVTEDTIEAEVIEKKLAEVFHYRLARELGQLKPARVFVAKNLSQSLASYYLSKKIKMGDAKPRLLWSNPEILSFLTNHEPTDSFLL